MSLRTLMCAAAILALAPSAARAQPAAPAMGAATLLPIECYRTGRVLPLPEVGTDGAASATPQ